MSASLELLEQESLSGLGLRAVTRAAGIAPTGFYRHFSDIPDLGVALVEETLGSLHGMIAAILAESGDSDRRIDRSVEVITRHVALHPAHFRFLARERFGGVEPVRKAIAAQLARFADEVTAVLATDEEARGWSEEDLRMLAGLYVDHMVMTAAEFLEAGPEGAERTAHTARRRLRLITVGRNHWLEEN